MSYRALKRWKSDKHAHTDTSGRQLKITFLDVLDYSEYLDTNIRKKKFRENIASSMRKQKREKIVFIDIHHLWRHVDKKSTGFVIPRVIAYFMCVKIDFISPLMYTVH